MLSLLLTAAALLVWPHVKPIRRLKPKRDRKILVPQWFWVVAAAAASYLVAGVGGLIAAALLAITVERIVKRTRQANAQAAANEALSSGLGGVIDELRAGAHAAAAAEGAAEDAPAPANEVLRAVAAASRLGGDVARTIREAGQPQLARAWQVSARHGVALADVLEATKRDLDQRAAFARQVHARMAGPRASALVLAGLPVFGVVLGELSGARPLHVLLSTGAGQVLLVLGAVFLAAGLWWTKRITQP